MSRLTDDQTRAVAQAIADELMRQEGSIDPPYPALPDDMELNYIDQRRVDMGAVARAAIAAALAEDSEDAEQSHQEGYDEGYREGQSDAAGAQSDFWRMMLRYFDKHGIEPASDDGEGYSAHQMMDALHEHESEVDAAHQAEIARRIIERDAAIYALGEWARKAGALEALLDVDRLTDIITDSIDIDWTPRTAAMALVRAMGGC
jgi:hypothetical protein